MKPVPLLYVLLYKKLDAACRTDRSIDIVQARMQLSRTFLGLDRERITRVFEEMEALGLVAEIRRDSLLLNHVDVPSI